MKIAFTDPYIRNLKIKGRYTDSATQGLNIQVKTNGAKYWTFRYLYQGKRHDLGLGTYPAISLKDARARATAARNEINQGSRPIAKWKPTAPVNQPAEPENRPTFSTFAKSCIESKKSRMAQRKAWRSVARNHQGLRRPSDRRKAP